MKTKIYANLITRLYIKNKQDESIKTFIEEILHELVNETNKEINETTSSKWDPFVIKRFLNFYFECYNENLISFNSIASLLEIFTNKIKSEKNHTKLYLYLIISNLHIIWDTLIQDNKEYLDRLIRVIDENIVEDKFSVRCNRIIKENDNYDHANSYLFNMWTIVKDNLNKRNHNRTSYILNLATMKLSNKEKIDISFNSNRNEININVDYLLYADGIVKGSEDILESSLNYTSLLSDLNKFERNLIKEYIAEIIFSFQDNLEKIYFYFNNFMNFYGVEEQINRDVDERNKDSQSDLLSNSIIDVIFTLILNTHNQDVFRVTSLSSLLFFCTKQNKNLSNISTTMINKLIDQVHKLDIQSLYNFSYFLSFHVSNLQFKFNLHSNEDQEKSGKDNNTGLKDEIFQTMLLDSLVTLGTKSKIEEMASFNKKLNISSFLNSYSERPNWKFYFGEQYHYDTVVINDHIQHKKEYHTWRDKFESSGNYFIYVLMSCLFFYKSKTLTHLKETLNYYKETIEYLTKDKQTIMLNALFDVWECSPVHLRFLIEYLLNNNLLDHTVLATYLVSERLSVTKQHWWKNIFNLTELVVVHPYKHLERSRILLVKEQEALAHSDESCQGTIIAHIEQFEANIEKLNTLCDQLPIQIVKELIKTYHNLKTNSLHAQANAEFIFETIIQLCRRFKKIIKDKLTNIIEDTYTAIGVSYGEIERIFENFESI